MIKWRWRLLSHAMPAMVLIAALLPGAASLAETTASKGQQQTPGTFGSFLAGMHAQAIRDFGSASDFLSRVLAADPDNVDLLQAAFVAMASEGRLGEAAGVGRRLEAHDAGSDVVNLVLALQDLKAGKTKQAAERAAKLSTSGVNRFTVPLVRAWIDLEDDNLDTALKTMAPLADVKGVDTLYNVHVGLLNEIGKQPDAAGKAYEQTTAAADRLSFRVVEIIGNFYERHKQADKAKALYTQFQAAYTGNPLIGLLLARLNDGRRVPPIVGNARQGLAEALYDLASVMHQEQANEMSLLYTRLGLDLQPDFPAAQVLLGDLLSGDGRLEDAVAIYRGIDQQSPFGWQARLQQAQTLNRLDRSEEAISLLQTMTKERSDSADAPMLLGDMLRAKERFAEAADAYSTAIARVGELKPEHWSLLYYRAIAYERSKQWDRAEPDFLKALEFQPDQPYVLNYLAYSWIELGRNYDRALEMLKTAVEKRPEDGYIVDSLGWVYYRLGQYDKAVEQLERAVELQPQDAVINDHLGDAYWRVGRQTEARVQWHRALSLEPEPDLVAPIQSKLERGLTNTPSGS
jgi:tetratricopeptide (TPR) repeat protein